MRHKTHLKHAVEDVFDGFACEVNEREKRRQQEVTFGNNQ